MDENLRLDLLGMLTPRQFMRRHWQKKPLLVRQAVPQAERLLDRARLFELAASEDTEARLVQQQGGRWRLRHGPFTRLPAQKTPHWTLLVQGMDLHQPALHGLLRQFRFVPDARLDDVMVSWASDGGGVGPHFDSYDVFLLQLQGRRRWRIGRQPDLRLRDDVPLKILAHFEPEEEFVLEPGDMLYLPPRYAHDGVAEGPCMTASVGFRAPRLPELGRELLQRLAEAAHDQLPDQLYRDPAQPAVAEPARVPQGLHDFAARAVAAALREPHSLACALGEVLSEPKAQVWFDAGAALPAGAGVVLDARTRMLYDARHVFINGESLRASGRDARLMHRLADERGLDAALLAQASEAARELLSDWCEAGWLHPAG